MLKIERLNVKIAGKKLINNFNLEIKEGEIHVLMGPNGSGKTTLSYAIAGHPKYRSSGKILLNKENLAKLPADERAKKGIFLAFQNPVEIEGLVVQSMIRKAQAVLGKSEDLLTFEKQMDKNSKILKLNNEFILRELNKGLSGGEKKKSEILQMLSFDPKLIILDEVDSGLDVDALKILAKAIKNTKNGKKAFLIITHYTNIFKYLKPDFVHVIRNGKIVKSGDIKLVHKIEKKGYEWITGN